MVLRKSASAFNVTYRPSGRYHARFGSGGKEFRRRPGTTDKVTAHRKLVKLPRS